MHQGWTEIAITEKGGPHAILGIVCAGLCFMQPLIAMMRCHPDHRRRSIFNWAHWFIGNAAQGSFHQSSARNLVTLPHILICYSVKCCCCHKLRDVPPSLRKDVAITRRVQSLTD